MALAVQLIGEGPAIQAGATAALGPRTEHQAADAGAGRRRTSRESLLRRTGCVLSFLWQAGRRCALGLMVVPLSCRVC